MFQSKLYPGEWEKYKCKSCRKHPCLEDFSNWLKRNTLRVIRVRQRALGWQRAWPCNLQILELKSNCDAPHSRKHPTLNPSLCNTVHFRGFKSLILTLVKYMTKDVRRALLPSSVSGTAFVQMGRIRGGGL